MNAATDPKTFGLLSGLLPEGSPRMWRGKFDFTSQAVFPVDLFQETADGLINTGQALFVDNADNSNPVTITLLDTLQRIVIPANAQGVVPFFGSKTPIFTIGTTQAAITVVVYLLNMPLPFLVWSAQTAGGGAGVNRGSYTNKGGTIVTGGVSQQIAAANATRKAFIVENPSTEVESLFVNFGAAATDNSATQDSVELLPGGSMTMDAAISTQTINVLAATTGHKFIAKEMA